MTMTGKVDDLQRGRTGTAVSPTSTGMVPHSRPLLGEAERQAVMATFDASWVGAGGEACAQFAAQVATSLNRPAAIPVASGSAALEIALRVIGVRHERVAMPAFSCASIERAIVRAGAQPHVLDADPTDLSFRPGDLSTAGQSCVAAVLVHQFGLPAGAVAEVAGLRMPVVEDLTAGIGATTAGREVGTFGNSAVLSFSSTKVVCAGEGGAIAGDVVDIERASQWADPESALPADQPVGNAKLSAMACALGCVQLRRLPELLARRRQIAAYYDEVLGVRGGQVLRPRPGDTGTWWRYLVAVEPGAVGGVVESALALGVCFARPVPHRRWSGRGSFPEADDLHARLVSAPIYPSLSDAEVERVAEALDAVIRLR